MYVPEHFAERDPELIEDYVRRWPFATLFTAGALGPVSPAPGPLGPVSPAPGPLGPWASHVPLVLDADGDLVGHLARANPQCADLEGPVLAVFAGPHAFVSSRVYERPEHQVPTWNYVAVHARGRGEVLADPLPALDLLMASMQPEDRVPSGEDDRDRYLQRLSAGIVAFRIRDVAWTAKAKLSQNRSAADQQRVVEALAASEDPGDRAVAELMRARRR
jgi:transcriptional regulator